MNEMRERMRSDPSKYHYISGREVVSKERSPSSQAAPPVAVRKEVALASVVKGSSKSDPFEELLERSKSLFIYYLIYSLYLSRPLREIIV